jgi:hypothetical protein
LRGGLGAECEQACSHGYCPGGRESSFQKAAPILFHLFGRSDLTHFESPLLSNIEWQLGPPPESSIIWLPLQGRQPLEGKAMATCKPLQQ